LKTATKQYIALDSWDEECKLAISKAKELANKSIEVDSDTFTKNVIDNIPQQFGDFLYTALGDRVTGQRSSVVNTEFIKNNPEMAQSAKDAGISMEKYLSQKASAERNPYNINIDQPQAFITAGRKFGVSYFTSGGSRMHTIYFGSGQAFKYLTQDHVDCIKNKEKRNCTQTFLDFRDNFIVGLNGMNNMLIETPIDIDLGVVSILNKKLKVSNHYRYPNDREHDREGKTQFNCMDTIKEGKITHTIVSMQDYKLWDKKSIITSRSVRSNNVSLPSYISLVFVNMNHKNISVVGNVDIGVSEVRHGLEHADDNSCSSVSNHLSFVQRDHRITNSLALPENYRQLDVIDSSGILMNMDKVMDNPAVRAILDDRLKFYMDSSARLQELKHENAALYFVNSDM
jgi:hypothetical protein